MTEKKTKIKNKQYREFLDEGIIKILTIEDIRKVLENMKSKYIKQARSFVIILYYSGARPVEALLLKGQDVTKENKYIIISFKTKKKGLPRKIYLSINRPFVKEFYEYSQQIFPEMYLFFNFQGRYVRKKTTKKGEEKEYIEITDKLRYHFKKWFSILYDDSLSPYYLRHNRISKLMQSGATAEEARLFKGARDLRSVMPYSHMSTESAKKLSKKID